MHNYKFPQIHTISDVLPFIEGLREFNVSQKDKYTVINYMVAFEATFQWNDGDVIGSAVRRECRGLIFNLDGELISRPYHKFFNAGEKEETQLNQINLYEPHVVLEKLDGSMIRPIPTADGFRLATKAGITDISEQAEEFIADKLNYSRYIKRCIQKGTTPIFEWCSRKNRIVVDYPEDQLILTGVRYLDTGAYVAYSNMKMYAESWDIPVVKAFAWNEGGKIEDNIEDMVEHIRKWEDSEGIVLRFDNGHMVKVKADDYILRHKSKESVSQEKNVIGLVLKDSIDDVIPLLSPEDSRRIQDFFKAFWIGIEDVATDLHDKYLAIDKGKSQKEFAIAVQQLPKSLQGFMFGMHRGVPAKTMLIDQISKSLTSQTKVNENRWMWGSLNWNQ